MTPQRKPINLPKNVGDLTTNKKGALCNRLVLILCEYNTTARKIDNIK